MYYLNKLISIIFLIILQKHFVIYSTIKMFIRDLKSFAFVFNAKFSFKKYGQTLHQHQHTDLLPSSVSHSFSNNIFHNNGNNNETAKKCLQRFSVLNLDVNYVNSSCVRNNKNNISSNNNIE